MKKNSLFWLFGIAAVVGLVAVSVGNSNKPQTPQEYLVSRGFLSKNQVDAMTPDEIKIVYQRVTMPISDKGYADINKAYFEIINKYPV